MPTCMCTYFNAGVLLLPMRMHSLLTLACVQHLWSKSKCSGDCPPARASAHAGGCIQPPRGAYRRSAPGTPHCQSARALCGQGPNWANPQVWAGTPVSHYQATCTTYRLSAVRLCCPEHPRGWDFTPFSLALPRDGVGRRALFTAHFFGLQPEHYHVGRERRIRRGCAGCLRREQPTALWRRSIFHVLGLTLRTRPPPCPQRSPPSGGARHAPRFVRFLGASAIGCPSYAWYLDCGERSSYAWPPGRQ